MQKKKTTRCILFLKEAFSSSNNFKTFHSENKENNNKTNKRKLCWREKEIRAFQKSIGI